MILTISRMPVPVPKTPSTSEMPARVPIIMPDNRVSAGMYLLRRPSTDPSDRLKPGTCTSASRRLRAAVLAERPPSSTHNLENTVTIAAINNTYTTDRSEEHTSELQSRQYLVCRLLLEKKKNNLCITL